MPARLAVPMLSLALATIVWLAMDGAAVVNYDTLYALLWGEQLLGGALPELAAPAAPTPHPLLTLLGTLAATFAGDAGPGALALIAWTGCLATAACAVLLGLVAKRSLGTATAVVAGLLLITREPVLSYGMRAYIDLPYLALLLAALALELGRARRGTAVLVCLLLAGLLRPEAWLLAFAYLAWLLRGDGGPPALPALPQERAALRRTRLVWIALAVAGPLLWLATDLLLTGDLLFSFQGTRAGTERLGRPTGLDALVSVAPRRIGEVLRWELLIAALAGALLLARGTVPKAQVLLAATLGAAVAFAAVAVGGLPVIVRYLLPLAAIGCVFAAHALTGWRADRSIPFGRAWIAGAAALLVAILALAPAQARRIDRLQSALAGQQLAVDELRVLVAQAPCGPVAVPNRRAVPLVALWTDVPAASVRTTQEQGAPARGSYVLPASTRAARAFVLDARDRERSIPAPPAGFREVRRTSRWVLAARCD